MATTLEQDTTQAAPAAEEKEEQKETRKVAIICSKGSLDMAYPGLIMANAARMMGIEAMLFFTFWGLDIITEKKTDHLKPGMLGNPSSPMPHSVMGLPGMHALAGKMMKKQMEDLEIPDVREMLEILDDAGAELYSCQLAMEMFGLEQSDLIPQVKESLTAMDFWEKAEGAQVVFV
jgi:peroxiredoxin family protein